MFRSGEQPFELARTRFTQGLLFLHSAEFESSRTALTDALRGFDALENRLWYNRALTALAALNHQTGDSELASQRMGTLLGDAHVDARGDGRGAHAIEWDANSLAEARLLHARILLETGEIQAAGRSLEQLAGELGLADTHEDAVAPMPHLHLRMEHLRGRVHQAGGAWPEAQLHYETALNVMERQRASLPLEEIRTSFLDDKASIYHDLILTLLDRPDATAQDLAYVFDIAERARSRSLLERIQAAVEDDSGGDASVEAGTHHEDLRREVHWLYTQLLEDPVRQHDPAFLQSLQAKEQALEQLQWKANRMHVQAEPANLAAFQGSLARDEQAIIYVIVRNEVMALRVDSLSIQVYRRLCTEQELHDALGDLRFQMGRAELGEAYLQRHRVRVLRMLHDALNRLYRLLVQPLRAELPEGALTVIPYGALHLLPFHALWDGQRYLVEQYEFRYAPSASLAIHSRVATDHIGSFRSFAGLALTDDTIPGARQEVLDAARHFPETYVFLDDEASRTGLERASSSAEILHIATHGLFRPDNSFFSALKLADGWIDVREIYRLPLTSGLVVLSACESGAGEVRGADEVVGLARGFIRSRRTCVGCQPLECPRRTRCRLYEPLLRTSGGGPE